MNDLDRQPIPALMATAQTLVAASKGILAIDESPHTCDQRFAALAIAQNEASRRDYRELLITTADLNAGISGVILHDETIRQSTAQGRPFLQVLGDAGILVGIKVDTGTVPLANHPSERITEGLDGLRDRLLGYSQIGARFTKWRGIVSIGSNSADLPSQACMSVNAHALARYAALSQEAGLVPIVEPEVMMEGPHTLEQCQQVSVAFLRRLFEELVTQKVVLEALILKTNMVSAGSLCPVQESAREVASASVQTLLRAVPGAVAGIAFLSGGQSAELATLRLNAMHIHEGKSPPKALPWPLTFSFARALQSPALQIWAGESRHIRAAQQALLHRVRCNQAALSGHFNTPLEFT